jgi:hypothetical protein
LALPVPYATVNFAVFSTSFRGKHIDLSQTGNQAMENHKLVLPEHLNQYGFLFGGNLLKWVDEYGLNSKKAFAKEPFLNLLLRTTGQETPLSATACRYSMATTLRLKNN